MNKLQQSFKWESCCNIQLNRSLNGQTPNSITSREGRPSSVSLYKKCIAWSLFTKKSCALSISELSQPASIWTIIFRTQCCCVRVHQAVSFSSFICHPVCTFPFVFLSSSNLSLSLSLSLPPSVVFFFISPDFVFAYSNIDYGTDSVC